MYLFHIFRLIQFRYYAHLKLPKQNLNCYQYLYMHYTLLIQSFLDNSWNLYRVFGNISLFHYFLLQFIPACKMGGIYSLLISLFGSCLIILICCIWHYQVIQRFNILQVLFCGKISLLKSIINKNKVKLFFTTLKHIKLCFL